MKKAQIPSSYNQNSAQPASHLLGGSRWIFALTHVLASAGVLALVAAGLFFFWYPPPYASLSGGLKLFALIALVDVLLGPLGTLVVSNPKKPKAEWRRDMAMIVVLQIAALAYGMWTVYEARPVHLVFEIDRFRVVPATDVPRSMLSQAPPELRQLPMTGPVLIATRAFRSNTEEIDATMAALQGLNIGARPDFWMTYADAVPAVLAAAKPVAELISKSSPVDQERLTRELSHLDNLPADVVYLPLMSRTEAWTVLLDRNNAALLAYVPVDGFGTTQEQK